MTYTKDTDGSTMTLDKAFELNSTDAARARLEAAVQDADEAFWAKIVKHYPEAMAGDLDPLSSMHWDNTMKQTVALWVAANCPNMVETPAKKIVIMAHHPQEADPVSIFGVLSLPGSYDSLDEELRLVEKLAVAYAVQGLQREYPEDKITAENYTDKTGYWFEAVLSRTMVMAG